MLQAALILKDGAAFHELCEIAGIADVPAAAAEVARAAAENWRGIDAYDFCIQQSSSNCVIFGSSNRLIWAPEQGLYPDVGYCTEKFRTRAFELGTRQEEILQAINSKPV